MKRGINGICSQFCPAAPREAGQGSLFFRGAGQLMDSLVGMIIGKVKIYT